MSHRIRSLRFWTLVITVLLNLAVATNLSAAWDNDTCTDPEGNWYPCCTWCAFFCDCDLDDDPGANS